MKKVNLIVADGVKFEVDEAVALQSDMIRLMIEGGCTGVDIPLANVDSIVMVKVLEYCEKHAYPPKNKGKRILHDDDVEGAEEDELRAWDTEYINISMDDMYHLLLAANFLNVKGLLDLVSQTLANMVKGKTVEEIREIFNIKDSGFTPEQDEQHIQENPWAFEYHFEKLEREEREKVEAEKLAKEQEAEKLAKEQEAEKGEDGKGMVKEEAENGENGKGKVKKEEADAEEVED